MGRICLVLPGNSFHANVQPQSWDRIDKEQAGLPAIGASGVPVSVCYQALDFEFFPWIRENSTRYPSIELTSAPFSHPLLPLLDEKQQAWEMSQRVMGGPVCFFPEFYAPKAHLIPEAFLVLAAYTAAYSVGTEYADGDTPALEQPYVDREFAKHAAISHGGKSGLVMKAFEPILKAFFDFQRDPVTAIEGVSPLDRLLDKMKAVADSTDEIIIIPLDLEAPYVGSLWGGKIWELLFDGIVRGNLSSYFISLKDALAELAPRAVKTRRPHRMVGQKWIKYEVQYRYACQIGSFQPRNDRHHMLLSIAGGSDVLAGLQVMVDGAKTFKAMDIDARCKDLQIGFNQEIVDVCYDAANALRKKGSLVEKIERRMSQDSSLAASLLMQKILAWTRANSL